MAKMDEMLGELSVDTLLAIMADLPAEQYFAIWRTKMERAVRMLTVELPVEVVV